MKTSVSMLESNEAVLNVELEPPEMEAAVDGAFRRLASKVNIPGFRKGKAPRHVLERYLGREAAVEEALRQEVPQAYQKALTEQGLEPYAPGQIEILAPEPLSFKATVPLRPTVELGDYPSIRVASEPVKVGDEEVDAALKQLGQQHALWEPVDRPAQYGDLITIDVSAEIDGQPVIDEKGASYTLVQGSPFPMPGFAEQVTGMRKGEEKSFQISVPQDYVDSRMAGKTASFKPAVLEIKQAKPPELDDAFARELEHKDMQDLREHLLADLKKKVEEEARSELEEKVVEQALSQAQFRFPPIMLEQEIDSLLGEQARYAKYARGGLDEYMKSLGKSKEEIRGGLQPVAEKRIKRSLFLLEIAKKEDLKPSEQEVRAEVEAIAGAAEKGDEVRRSLLTPSGRASINQLLMMRKARQRLGAIASPPQENKPPSEV